MLKVAVSTGIFWVEIPEARLSILCGCPADSVKHLMKRGLIVPVERGSVTFETGPNAILLSDVAVQNERFSNLGEFPVLQMLYRQGMILPDHPNNRGVRPLIIGSKSQIRAQTQYIYRGNYGIVDKKELSETGLKPAEISDLMRFKRRFAFDAIRPTEELLETRVVGSSPVELRAGATIRRLRTNVFEIACGGEKAVVDLNLGAGAQYEAPFHLGFHDITREYFSIVHSGEGDGWDPNRPCMGSVISYQGRLYLVDAGPNIVHTLAGLGLSANDIEGLFQTHAHDDHFAGIPTLMRADHKIKFYSTRLVRLSVAKKLSALLSVSESYFDRWFEVHDLPFDEWTDIQGLEVRPVLSPHPVETNIFFFRTIWENGHRIYAHLADICSMEVLSKMVTKDGKNSGVSPETFERVKREYLTTVDLKKIDVGGGPIHGQAKDFARDKSVKLLLSHTSRPLSDREKEIGGSTSFGMVDVLISAQQDFVRERGFRDLQSYFPAVPVHELRLLLNCPGEVFNPGSILITNGELPERIYFVLSGLLEYIDAERDVHAMLSAGSMVGELAGLFRMPSQGTYRALSSVHVLHLSCDVYSTFLTRNGLMDDMKYRAELRTFLLNSWLFGEMVSSPVKNRILRNLLKEERAQGDWIEGQGRPSLYLLDQGELEILSGETPVATVGPGGFFGCEIAAAGRIRRFRARATKPSVVYRIPASAIADIPVVQWKLLETYERRVRATESRAPARVAVAP